MSHRQGETSPSKHGLMHVGKHVVKLLKGGLAQRHRKFVGRTLQSRQWGCNTSEIAMWICFWVLLGACPYLCLGLTMLGLLSADCRQLLSVCIGGGGGGRGCACLAVPLQHAEFVALRGDEQQVLHLPLHQKCCSGSARLLVMPCARPLSEITSGGAGVDSA